MERTIQKSCAVPGGGRVVVDIYGDPDSPGIVLLPGVMSDARSWEPVAIALSSWPSVTVVNRRGRVPSSALPENYSVFTEVADLRCVLEGIGGARTVLGWSYGGLIALLAANIAPVRQLIAYEPVVRPFGVDALPALAAADRASDWDAVVEVVNRQVSGFGHAYVAGLRADPQVWAELCRLAGPLAAELHAIDAVEVPERLAERAEAVDLIVGGDNVGAWPYGEAFDRVCRHICEPTVSVLPEEGHLAHLTAPRALATFIDQIASRP